MAKKRKGPTKWELKKRKFLAEHPDYWMLKNAGLWPMPKPAKKKDHENCRIEVRERTDLRIHIADLWCVDCQKHIKFLSREDYNTLKELQ